MFCKFSVSLAVGFLLVGCVKTGIMPLSTDTFQVTSVSDESCGITGAQKVAISSAAIETIKRGYDRFEILGQNNDSYSQLMAGPAETTTSVTVNADSSATLTTSSSSGLPMMFERNEQVLHVRTVTTEDPGFSVALSAKGILGENWAELVEKGKIRTCM